MSSRPRVRPCASCHVRALRTAVEADRHQRDRRAAGGAHRVLLALRAPGESAVRRAVRRRLHRRAARHDGADVHRPRRHAGHRERTRRRCSPITGRCCSAWRWCCWSLRPLAITAQNLLANQAIAANVSNLIRWQNHWHVVRQSWAFFQNDFAGRIANRVMQTGPAMRESRRRADHRRLVHPGLRHQRRAAARHRRTRGSRFPVTLWFAGYLVLLRVFVPRMRDRSKEMSEARSLLTGRIVDSYTNILTVKLFARAREEDAYVREALEQHTGRFHRSLRLNTLFSLQPDDAERRASSPAPAGIAILLWTQGTRRGRRRRDGDPADLADRQRGRLGRLPDHLDLREHRRGAGRHDDDRAADRRSPMRRAPPR